MVYLRVVDTKQPYKNATHLLPELEDAYLYEFNLSTTHCLGGTL